jgi:predicted enzyme related to lactoylglutathione lyase
VTVTLEAGIVARDPSSLCDFYTSVMHFTLLDHRTFDAGEVYRLRRGEARLKIFCSVGTLDPHTTIEPWYRPGGWRYAALHLDQPDEVDALTTAVRAARGQVLIPPTQHGTGGRLALVSDPEGNTWELLADAPTAESETT